VGAGGGESVPPENLPDPKDRIADRDRLTGAETAHARRGRGGRAADLRRRPGAGAENRAATLRSGVALLKLGRIDPAVERLERSVRLDPTRAEARFALADALMRKGRFREAATHWAEMARLQPGRFEAWANLGTALLNDARPAEAADALRRALALRPDDPVTRARQAAASGRTAEARAVLAAAVAERPDLRAALSRDAILGPLLP
jgi:tetratricopeptide (TPR) repeat protein